MATSDGIECRERNDRQGRVMGRGLTRPRSLLCRGTFAPSPEGEKKKPCKEQREEWSQELDFGRVAKEMSPERGPLGGGGGRVFFFSPDTILQTLPRSQSSVVPLPSKIPRFDIVFMNGDCIRKLRVVQKTCDEIKLKKE